jgi:hypothetical protein
MTYTKLTHLLVLIGVIGLSSCIKEGVHSSETITLRPGAIHGKDAIIHSNRPDVNSGLSESNIIMAWTYVGGGLPPGATRSLIQFDLSVIPTNATIQSAQLSLYNDFHAPNNGGDHASLTGSNKSQIHFIKSAWDEFQVTWGNQPSFENSLTVPLAESISANQDYLDIDITEFTKIWHEDPSTNHGILLKLVTEQYYRLLLFASSDNEDQTLHPKLVVKYTI